MRQKGMKVLEYGRKIVKQICFFLKENFWSVVVVIALGMLSVLGWNLQKIRYEDIVETVKVSVTVLISMLGFSVSIYVFLNNTFQSRRNSNELEKEVIEKFQAQKRNSLGISIIFSAAAITGECVIVVFQRSVDSFFQNIKRPQLSQVAYFLIITVFIIVTIFNIYKLGYFTYGVINYENGLKKLAKKEMSAYKENRCYQKMTKGEFLNLVNNIEVLVERLIRNHLHAKISTAYDTNLKRAICDGDTEPGDIITRENLAKVYKEVVDYRNLLLQDVSMMDSADVAMGDQVKSVLNGLFQRYLNNELLTGVNINNLVINDAYLEKTSFSNSSFKAIKFEGKVNLKNTDFRDSTLNDICFLEADCENINFSNCKLIAVTLNTKMKLHRAIFTNADLSGMGDIGPQDKEGEPLGFTHANFSVANLTFQDIYNVCFDFSDFSNARIGDSKIGKSAQKANNTTFVYANMERVDLLRCVIERSDFQNANLNGATFTYAKMFDVNFSECRINGANLSKSIINRCKFDKSYCTNFSMKGTVLKDSSFIYAIMISADLSGAQITNVCFNDAVCRDTLWVRTQIERASFERCVLANARIVGEAEIKVRISNCKFLYTDLSNSAIANIEFYNCDFKGADFTNARLVNVLFFDCKNLDKAISEKIWLAETAFGGQQKTVLEKGQQNWRYEDIKIW